MFHAYYAQLVLHTGAPLISKMTIALILFEGAIKSCTTLEFWNNPTEFVGHIGYQVRRARD